MGEIRAEIIIRNTDDLALFEAGHLPADKVRQMKMDALVDTGAVMVLLPQDIVDTLGLKIKDKLVVTLANDEKIELHQTGGFSLSVCGRETVSDCLVGPPLCEPLIGQLVLERLDLVLNPLKKTITPNPNSPYLPNLKLK